MASRLAFMKEHGLLAPATPALLAAASDADFCRAMGRQLGRGLPLAEWRDWVETQWLPSAHGQRWGVVPAKNQNKS